jgi:endosialidase-like protein
MKTSRIGSISALVISSLSTASIVHAIPLPDSGSCSGANAQCLTITATGSQGKAVQATSSSGIAVRGDSSGSYGLYGTSTSRSAIYGTSENNTGVEGQSGSGAGVFGQSQSSNGIHGVTQATAASGVYGLNFSGFGYGTAGRAQGAGVAIYGDNTSANGWAGLFDGRLQVNGQALKPGGGSWASTSDQRVKKEVKEFHPGLAQLLKVRPVLFKYNGLAGTADDGKEYVGVIAQELEKVLPGMVSSRMATLHEGDEHQTTIRQVDPSAFTYLLINAVKEQQKVIERQEVRIARLEGRGGATMSSFWPDNLGREVAFALMALGLVAVIRKSRWSRRWPT